jgi:hypothetical protein
MVFCVLLFAGNALAQEDWVPVEIKHGGRSKYYLDRNFNFIQTGFLPTEELVEYRVKSMFEGRLLDIEVFWLNCRDRRFRLVSIPYGKEEGFMIFDMMRKEWKSFESVPIDGELAVIVCEMIKAQNVPKVSNNKKLVKKVVSRTRKRKQ